MSTFTLVLPYTKWKPDKHKRIYALSMKPIQIFDTFKNTALAQSLLAKINTTANELCFMEVCGTHTVELFKTGIKAGLAKNIRLISGPGCPVCVTTTADIDKAIALASQKDIILCCFGDMVRVPGTEMSIESAHTYKDAHFKIIYNPIEALALAQANPSKTIVMFGVGFETTAPAFAAVLTRAKQINIRNLFIFPVFKLIPPALRALLTEGHAAIDGFILPGHVSTIIGVEPYRFIADDFHKPAVITGFEMVDMLEGLLLLIEMIKHNSAHIEIEYKRSVEARGNLTALNMMHKVFKPSDAMWRGLGVISQSGLTLQESFKEFDIDSIVSVAPSKSNEHPDCRCGEILQGKLQPKDCPLYASACTPQHPVGPCMVSSEGTCAASYHYAESR